MAAGDLTVRVDMGEVMGLLTAIWGKLENMVTQADMDALAQQLGDTADQLTAGQQALLANNTELTQAVTDMAADIAAIKAAAPAALDATNLEANAARVGAAATALSTATGQLTTAVDSAQQLAADNAPPPPA